MKDLFFKDEGNVITVTFMSDKALTALMGDPVVNSMIYFGNKMDIPKKEIRVIRTWAKLRSLTIATDNSEDRVATSFVEILN